MYEETGLQVETATFLGVFSDPTRIIQYGDGDVCRVLTIAFVVTPRAGVEPRVSDESLELLVVPRARLADLPLWPAAAPIVAAYLAFDGTPLIA